MPILPTRIIAGLAREVRRRLRAVGIRRGVRVSVFYGAACCFGRAFGRGREKQTFDRWDGFVSAGSFRLLLGRLCGT